jgi:hypothetical protein
MQKFRPIEDEKQVAIREKLYKTNLVFVENDQSTL